MPIPCNPRISFSFAPPDSSDRPFPLTNLIALQTLTQEGKKKKKSLIYMDINFYTTCFCPNFSQNRFFFFFTISTFSCFTLLILRFGDQFALTYLPADRPSSYTSQGNLQAILPHVTLLSCMSISFPARHQTSSIKEEQLRRMLLHKRLPSFLIPYSTDMTIY